MYGRSTEEIVIAPLEAEVTVTLSPAIMYEVLSVSLVRDPENPMDAVTKPTVLMLADPIKVL